MASHLTFKQVGELSVEEGFYSKDGIQDMANGLGVNHLSVNSSFGHRVVGVSSGLSVVQTDIGTYINKIAGTSKYNENMMYLVKSNGLNGFGKRIKNVAAPVDSTDIATKGYLDKLLTDFESEMYHYSSKTPYDDQTADVGSFDVNFGKLLDFYNNTDKFKIYSVTLWTHQSTGIQSGTKIDLYQSINSGVDFEYIGKTEMLNENVPGNQMARFVFERPIVIDRTANYRMVFTNSSGAIQTVGLRLTKLNSDARGVYVYRTNGTPYGSNIQPFIFQIEARILQNVITGIVIVNSLNTTERFLVQINNGNLEVTKQS